MLRLFSRVARHPSSLKTLGDSLVGPRCSYGLQALGFSSGPSQPDGPPEKKQEGEQPATEGGKKEQAAADAGKNPQLQRYLESLVQLKGTTKVKREILGQAQSPWWQQLIVGYVERWMHWWMSELITARIEEDFSMDEFLEGTKDAYFIVNHLLSSDDFDTLRNGMLSAKLLEALQATKREYAEAGFGWRMEVDGDIHASMRSLRFWSREMMAAYDPERAKEAPAPVAAEQGPSGLWLVLTVALRAKQDVVVSRLEEGTISAEMTDYRPQHWRFATGPLPGGLPVRRLETPWFLVSI